MHKRWLAEFGVSAVYKRLCFERTRDLNLVRLTSRRLGPLVVRKCAEDFAVLNTVIVFDAYRLPADQQFRSILDLGSNIGIATRTFLQCLPAVPVLAVEPSSANCELFRHNVDLCGIASQVQLLQCAAGPVETTGVFSTATTFDRFKVQSPCGCSHSEEQEVVPVRSMAQLTEQLSAPILLKMDVEGSEVELLNCRAEWISKVSYMMIEFHDSIQEKQWIRVLAAEGWKPEKHFDTWHFSVACNP